MIKQVFSLAVINTEVCHRRKARCNDLLPLCKEIIFRLFLELLASSLDPNPTISIRPPRSNQLETTV